MWHWGDGWGSESEISMRTDWFVRHIYEKMGFFTPPYETAFSLKNRLEKRYAAVTLGTVKGMAWFVCRKAE